MQGGAGSDADCFDFIWPGLEIRLCEMFAGQISTVDLDTWTCVCD